MRGKWTEGPWTVVESGFGETFYLVCEDKPGRINPVCAAERESPDAEANAYLIAASPALADLAESVAAMRVYVNNPSAWDSFDEGISEMLRSLVADAEAALSLAHPQPKGEEA